MLSRYANRLKRIRDLLQPGEEVETICIYWGRENHIPPPRPGVRRFYWIEYAPPGTEVEWDEAAGFYPPLPTPADEDGESPAGQGPRSE